MTTTPGTAPGPNPESPSAPRPSRSVLDWIEWAGNKLPEPAILFALLALAVIVLSAIGSSAGWSVQPVKPQIVMQAQMDAQGNGVLDATGQAVQVARRDGLGKPVVDLVNSGEPITPKSLLNAEGVYWMLSSMLRNFAQMPALPLILSRCWASGWRSGSDFSLR